MKKSIALLCFAALLLLAPHTASAGWTDTLKQAGTQIADEQAKSAGLSYTPSEAVAGVKEVLSAGTDFGVSSLTSSTGFSASDATALSLPTSLSSLSGASSLLSSLNTAATDSVPETGTIFQKAIQSLSVSDSASLLGSSSASSSSTAITDYFESSSRDTLKPLVKPVVEKYAASAGVGTYTSSINTALQAAGGTTFDANDYLTDKVLDGMFYYMGEKEKSLRESGGAGASALLQKLF